MSPEALSGWSRAIPAVPGQAASQMGYAVTAGDVPETKSRCRVDPAVPDLRGPRARDRRLAGILAFEHTGQLVSIDVQLKRHDFVVVYPELEAGTAGPLRESTIVRKKPAARPRRANILAMVPWWAGPWPGVPSGILVDHVRR